VKRGRGGLQFFGVDFLAAGRRQALPAQNPAFKPQASDVIYLVS
jgi:hypothetical protein